MIVSLYWSMPSGGRHRPYFVVEAWETQPIRKQPVPTWVAGVTASYFTVQPFSQQVGRFVNLGSLVSAPGPATVMFTWVKHQSIRTRLLGHFTG
jgi:hypothetical protein